MAQILLGEARTPSTSPSRRQIPHDDTYWPTSPMGTPLALFNPATDTGNADALGLGSSFKSVSHKALRSSPSLVADRPTGTFQAHGPSSNDRRKRIVNLRKAMEASRPKSTRRRPTPKQSSTRTTSRDDAKVTTPKARRKAKTSPASSNLHVKKGHNGVNAALKSPEGGRATRNGQALETEAKGNAAVALAVDEVLDTVNADGLEAATQIQAHYRGSKARMDFKIAKREHP